MRFDDITEDAGPATEDLFEMANLFPRTTGLPMTVWVSPRGNARHDVRIKVNMTHGNQMNAANTAVVGNIEIVIGVRPENVVEHLHIGGEGILLYGGDSIILTGASLTATGQIIVNGEGVEVPALMLWKLV